jgi:hypothetical protein
LVPVPECYKSAAPWYLTPMLRLSVDFIEVDVDTARQSSSLAMSSNEHLRCLSPSSLFLHLPTLTLLTGVLTSILFSCTSTKRSRRKR